MFSTNPEELRIGDVFEYEGTTYKVMHINNDTVDFARIKVKDLANNRIKWVELDWDEELQGRE